MPRTSWKPLLAATIATAVAITALGPNHNDLQLASNAEEFRDLLGEPGRHLAAAIADIGFAVSYGLLGVVALQIVGRGTRVARIAAVVIVVGAAADVVENGFLIRNIIARSSLTDGWVDAMQVPGTIKWLATPAFLVLFAMLIAHVVRRRSSVSE